MELGVYVPIEGTVTTIKPGSAICGMPYMEWTGDMVGMSSFEPRDLNKLQLYYEGNLYGHMADWETQLFHAADRLIAKYPTVGRCTVDPVGFMQVGWYDHDRRTLDVEEQEILDAWIAAGRHAPNPTVDDLIELLKETQ